MTYTTAQILAAAEAAEVSMIDAQHICDTLVKMNDKPVKIKEGDFRKMVMYDDFQEGEIVKVIQIDESTYTDMRCLCVNKHSIIYWVYNDSHEPTTETF